MSGGAVSSSPSGSRPESRAASARRAHEPRRICRQRGGRLRRTRTTITSRRRSARDAAHSINATSIHATAITPAITAGSSLASAAAMATAARNSASSRSRGTVGRRAPVPRRPSQAYDGVTAPARPVVPAGRDPEGPARRAGGHPPEVPRPDPTARGRALLELRLGEARRLLRCARSRSCCWPAVVHLVDRLAGLRVDARAPLLDRLVDRSRGGLRSGGRCPRASCAAPRPDRPRRRPGAAARRGGADAAAAVRAPPEGGDADEAGDPGECALHEAMVSRRAERPGRVAPVRGAGRACRDLAHARDPFSFLSYRFRFLPLHARAIPSSCLPVRPPKTEGRRKGNP